jgi:hypothetical protein
MNYATAWFLVMIGGQQYVGPLGAESCQNAARALQGEGVVCRQPTATTACRVDGLLATYTLCPVFNFPQVTIKP